MSRFLAPFLLLFSLLSNAPVYGQELSQEDQQAYLARLQANRREFPALNTDFSEERTSELLVKPIVSTGTITFEAPNKFRRELKGALPSLTVCNGEKLWIYHPNFKLAELYTLGEKQLFDDSIAALTAGLNFTDVDRYFRVSAVKEGAGYRVTLTPKSRSIKKFLVSLEVWADNELRVTKTHATLPKGDRVVTTYRNQNPMKRAGNIFDFTPPAGVEISKPLGK